MSGLNLGALDFCKLAPGQRPSDRLAETLELACEVDRLGFTRYWLSEHHTANVAHASPELLVPLILSRTRRLRVGPAGILLRYYSPLKVADGFRCIEALFPGRVDLGIARGFADPLTASALLDGAEDTPGSYERKATDLVAYVRDSVERDAAKVEVWPTPTGGGSPEPWVLGTSTSGGPLAARLGTALSIGLFLKHTEPTAGIVEQYRAAFQPASATSRPRWNIAVTGICADTFEDAVDVLRRNRNPNLRANVVGTPEQCWDRLELLARQYQTDEIVVAPLGRTHDERLRTFRLLAHEAAVRQHTGRPRSSFVPATVA